MEELKVFLFVLSILFLLKNVVVFILKFFQEEPEEMKFNIFEKIMIYISLSYIITYIIL